jgi:hypothetical protein
VPGIQNLLKIKQLVSSWSFPFPGRLIYVSNIDDSPKLREAFGPSLLMCLFGLAKAIMNVGIIGATLDFYRNSVSI